MKTELKPIHHFTGTGSRKIWAFAQLFQDKLIDVFEKYEAKSGEPAFWFGELQTKTFVTVVLWSMCECLIMQEYPIDKKFGDRNELMKTGRADYWLRYGNISFLMEFKQAWQYGYYNRGSESLRCSFGYVLGEHYKAFNQIRSLKNPADHTPDNLYKIALTISPIYVKRKRNSEDPTKISKNLLNDYLENVQSTYKDKYKNDLSGIGNYIRKKAQSYEIDGDNSCKYRDYPAIFFYWTIRKATKK